MPTGVIISDKFWIVGPKFAFKSDSTYRPQTTKAVELKPGSPRVRELAPVSGSASPLATPPAELSPLSTSALSLKPIGRGINLRPRSGSATEE
jgi:hypothetical protein